MFTLTSEFFTRHARIALYFVAGTIAQKGWVSESFATQLAGLALGGITWAWSLYGNRLVAKVNELVKVPNLIVIAPATITNETPSPSAMPMETTTVVAPEMIARAVNAENDLANVRPEETTRVTTTNNAVSR